MTNIEPMMNLAPLTVNQIDAFKNDDDAFLAIASAWKGAVEIYLDKAFALIREEPDRGKQLRYYYQVMNRVKEHLTLLWDMARPDLPFLVEDGSPIHAPSPREAAVQQQLESFTTSRPDVAAGITNEQLLNWIVRVVARRIDSPKLTIFGTQYFKIVHFNYVNGVAVIGVPVDLMLFPNWDMSILWHEVAGYEVREKSKSFKRWIYELDEKWEEEDRPAITNTSSIWDLMQPYFALSFIDNAHVGIKPNGASEDWPNDFKTTDLLEGVQLRTDVDSLTDFINEQIASDDWKVGWLMEFFEDLFSVHTLRWATIEALVEAVVQQGKPVFIGDLSHPPLNLRTEVSLAYLEILYQELPGGFDHPVKRVRERLERVATDLFHYTKSINDEKSDLQIAAQTIAAFYWEKVVGGEFSIGQEDWAERGVEMELAVAEFILELRQEYLYSPKSPNFDQLQWTIAGKFKQLRAQDEWDTQDPPVPNSKFLEDIAQAPTIDAFLKIEFTSIDYALRPDSGGAGGGTGPGMIPFE